MLIISHRGNLYGPSSETENTTKAIDKAIAFGFKVEIDIQTIEEYGTFNKWRIFLGHDKNGEAIDYNFLNTRRRNLFVHAKTLQVANYLIPSNLNWFYHETDKMTLTSYGVPWCYPGTYLKKGITVQFGKPDLQIPKTLGICTDYPIDFRNTLLENK